MSSLIPSPPRDGLIEGEAVVFVCHSCTLDNDTI